MNEKKNKRVRKHITLPPLANEIVKILSEEDSCSESETIGRLIKYYAEKERPEILEKVRSKT